MSSEMPIFDCSLARISFAQTTTYLVFIDLAILQFGLTLLLKRDNNQGYENIHKEERENDEVDHIKYGHFDTKIVYRSLILIRSGHGVL